jgi:hypothetical protein
MARRSIEGDVVSPRVAIAEGAQFHGSIDMQQKGTRRVQPAEPLSVVPKPAPAAPAPVFGGQPQLVAAAQAH